LRIVHINNIGGVAWDLRTAQRDMGDDATVIAPPRYSLNGQDVPLKLDGFVGINLEMAIHYQKHLKAADVVHIHGGLRMSQIVFPLLHSFTSAKWVLHYHGSETRMGYGLHHQNLADLRIVATPDLLAYHKTATWLPNPIEERLFEAPMHIRDESGPLVVGHFPGNASIKGTERIVRTLAPLSDSGKIKLLLAEGLSHDRLLASMAKADVLIDQLSNLKIFGKTSLEAMVQGIPALSSYDPSLYPSDCPVVSVRNEEQLFRTIEGFVDAGMDDGLVMRGIDFVKEHHRPRKIALTLREMYERVIGH
jgi:hypothetical protein